MLPLFSTLALSSTYNVVVDAGSNSKLYVFKTTQNETSFDIKLVNQTYTSKGTLANAYYNLDVISQIFNELCPKAEKIINADSNKSVNLSTVPFFVAGTSLMRDLDIEDRYMVQNNTYNYIKQNCKFNITNETVTTLSAKSEAIYTYVTVNIASKDTSVQTVIGLSGGNNFVATKESNGLLSSDTITYGTHKDVIWVFTYPAFSTKSLINNYTLSSASLAGQAFINSSCYLTGYQSDEDDFISIKGEGNYTACNQTINDQTLIFEQYYGYKEGYFFNKIERPKLPSTPVYATGDSYTSNFEGLFESLKDTIPEMANFSNITLDDFITAADKYCALPLEDVKRKTSIPEQYLAQDCLEMSLQARILKFGFNLENDQVFRYSQINGVPIGWQAGIVTTFYSPEPDTNKAKQWIGIILSLAIVIIIIIIVTVVICKCVKKHKEEQAKQVNYVDPSAFDNLNEN